MSKKIDLTGQRVGKLIVVKEAGRDKHGGVTWLCQCDCGNTRIVSNGCLKRKVTTSCGCSNWYIQIKDITGNRYGRLVVLRFIKTDEKRRSLWECQCDCGKTVIVQKNNLTSGNTKSCGCLSSSLKTTHNKSKSRLYSVWHGMKQRCLNPNVEEYKNYGGRGIKICPEWMDFETFYQWAISNGFIESSPKGQNTIDRIDVNGNYEPLNCRFVNMSVQSNNTRRNKLLTYQGRTQTISQWANEIGINRRTLEARIVDYHWSVEKALTYPVNENMRRFRNGIKNKQDDS